MDTDAHHMLGAIAIGLGATLVMDLWNLFLKRAFGVPSLNYCLLGRWLRHMPGGTLRHASVTAAPQKPFECSVGWVAHYTIGVVLALVFVLASGDWLARPTLLPALLYGIGTVVFPFFIMQPSFGLGLAASRTPKPAHARLKSLVTHAVFGAGVYLCALGVSTVLRVRAEQRGAGRVMRYVLGLAAVASLYCLHRLALWAERRGWIYYRRKLGSSGTLSSALLEVHSLFDPSKRYVLKEKMRDQVEGEDSGDPPTTGTDQAGPQGRGTPDDR